MKKSKFGVFGLRDIAYGFVVAVFGAILTALHQILSSNMPFNFDWPTFEPIIKMGITAGFAYIIKNILSNSNGEILKKEALGPGGGSNPPVGTEGLPK